MGGDELPYGPVKVIAGPHAGRIGYYDDETDCQRGDIDWSSYPDGKKLRGYVGLAIIYFGGMFVAAGSYYVPQKYISKVTMKDLLDRRERISRECSILLLQDAGEYDPEDHLDLVLELYYVDMEISDRTISLWNGGVSLAGKNVFVSHSSFDKPFARLLAVSLKDAGHNPWLDEFNIMVGESIPEKISDGLVMADFVIVVLSKRSVESKWVEREWQIKYWDEVGQGKVRVLPILVEDCNIPSLLQTKRYADFRGDYNEGLSHVLKAIDILAS